MGLWTDHVVPRITDISLRAEPIGRLRAQVCAGLAGRVVEIGFGSGRNVDHYPAEITDVDAVEPSDVGWRMSARRRVGTSLPINRVGLDGQAIAADDASYDAALCTFSLCTIPDPLAALAEIRRVVRPGGRFHFLEHGLSDEPGTARWQRRLDPWQQRLAGGCHLTRDPADLVTSAGLTLGDIRTGRFEGIGGPRALTFGYLGSARV